MPVPLPMEPVPVEPVPMEPVPSAALRMVLRHEDPPRPSVARPPLARVCLSTRKSVAELPITGIWLASRFHRM